MSASPAAAADDEATGTDMAASAAPRISKKVMIIAGAAILVLICGAIAAYFLMRPAAAAGEHHEEPAEVPREAYVDVPAMIVNLRSSDGAARLIKLHVLLVPTTAEKSEEIKARLPLVIDRFQPFLRELRPEDLAGSAALFRIKEELLLRANDAAGPASVSDVLVQDLIQQ